MRTVADKGAPDATATAAPYGIRVLMRSTIGRTYGQPINAELEAEGTQVSSDRVARLMRDRCVHGVCRRKSVKTTTRNRDARPAPDLVERKFTADAPDRLWVADITHVPTWSGCLYPAVVLDTFSRRIVGWSMSTPLRT